MPKKTIDATEDLNDELLDDSEELNQELGTVESENNEELEVEVPEKFKGKSQADIIKSYTELESALGRQAKELGDLRRWSQEQVRRDLEATKKPSKEEDQFDLTEDDFIRDPVSATTKLVDKRLERIEKALLATNSNVAEREFQNKHPDYMEIGASPEFQEWVMKTPYRMNMFERADNRDFLAADELISMYKEHSASMKEVNDDVSNAKKADNRSKMKRMAGESEAAPSSSKKVYTNQQIIDLKLKDPDKYERMLPEIMKAYQEGRVR